MAIKKGTSRVDFPFKSLSAAFLVLFSGVVTPLPIPNREVKHSSGDGSGDFGPCKSSSVPGTLHSTKEKELTNRWALLYVE